MTQTKSAANTFSFTFLRALKPLFFFWIAPAFGPLLLWFLPVIGVLALSVLLFHRRRAEISGFLGRSRWLNFSAVCILGMGAFALLQEIFVGYLPLACAAGFLIYALIFLLAELALRRSRRELRGHLKLLPLHLGIAAAALLICTTGLFGYSTRVPKAAEVESIALRSVTHPSLTGQLFYTGRYRNYGEEYAESAQEAMLSQLVYHAGRGVGGVTDPEKIQALLQLHKKIAKAGRQAPSPLREVFGDGTSGITCQLTLAYRLKNGKTFVRQFSSSTAALLEELAALEQSLMDSFYEEAVQPPAPDADSAGYPAYSSMRDSAFFQKQAQEEELKLFQQNLYHPNSRVILRPTHLDEGHALKLTAEQKACLLAAVRQDLTAQTAQQSLFPDAPSLGTLVFPVLIDTEMPLPEGANPAAVPEISGNHYSMHLTRPDSTSQYALIDPSDEYYVSLTPEMTQTLAFLRELGQLEKLVNRSAVVRAQVYPAVRPTEGTAGILSLQFVCHAQIPSDTLLQEDSFLDASHLLLPQEAAVVTDTALLKTLEENAHLQYYISRNGYVVEFETDKDGFVTMFVPAEKMPQSIADAIQ